MLILYLTIFLVCNVLVFWQACEMCEYGPFELCGCLVHRLRLKKGMQQLLCFKCGTKWKVPFRPSGPPADQVPHRSPDIRPPPGLLDAPGVAHLAAPPPSLGAAAATVRPPGTVGAQHTDPDQWVAKGVDRWARGKEVVAGVCCQPRSALARGEHATALRLAHAHLGILKRRHAKRFFGNLLTG